MLITNHLTVQVSAYQSGVSLVVDKSEVTTVSLLLQTVRPEDGGEYECRPDNAPPASARLHVIKGELGDTKHDKEASHAFNLSLA